MARRMYKGNTVPTTLLGPITNSALTFTVVASGGSTYPDGSTGNFVVTLDYGASSGEEKVLCSARTGDVFTIASRGYDSTAAAAHAAGANVRHTISAVDMDEPNAHINDTTLDQHTQYGLVKKTLLAARAAIAHRSMQFWYGIDNDYLSVDDGTTWHDFPSKAVNDTLYLTPAAANAAYVPQPASPTALYVIRRNAANNGWEYAAPTSALFARKTANQSVTSSTVLVNDTHLLLALAANSTYTFDALLIVNAGDTAADIRLAFTVPAGATLTWTAPGGLSIASTGSSSGGVPNANVVTSSGTFENYAVVANVYAIPIKGSVKTAGTAGNLQLQFAQNVSSATSTTLVSESFLQALQVA